jgi:two-component system sensor histidine kinase BaeS
MSIRSKLFFTLLFCGAILVLVPAAFSYLSFNNSLKNYLGNRRHSWLHEITVELEAYYRHYHNWDNIAQQRFWLLPIFQRPDDQKTAVPSLNLIRRLSLLDRHKNLVAGSPLGENPTLIPLRADNQIVGWLAYPRVQQLRGEQERLFQERQASGLAFIGLFAILLAALFSWLLARHLVTPIESLSRSTRQLAKGNYGNRTQVSRHDELGQLADDINQLASSLEKGQHSRERWLADISHELRTPVAILQGEIQALVDGIREPDARRLASLEQETRHLHKLLDDLHDLALADSGSLRYHMESLDLAQLVDETAAAFDQRLHDRGLTLELSGLEQPSLIKGDDTRLRQLLHNLIDNAVKYTYAGGLIRLSLENQGSQVSMTLSDSAPGVSDEQLPRLFDHLFRVESSRNRSLGGSGLGLAICQRIAHAHQGELYATHSPLGGLSISLSLPKGKFA